MSLAPRLARQCILSLLLMTVSAADAPATAQSMLERPPNLQDTWVGTSGTVHFNFMHRFTTTGPPTRKVIQTPTFLLGVGLPWNTLIGAHYATNSTLVPQIPNEWEFFVRYRPLSDDEGAPLDLSIQTGFNEAARSWDGQVAAGKRLGAVRLLTAARVFSNAFDQSEARFALAAGATVRFSEFVAAAADYGRIVDLDESEGEPAWSVGLQLAIPYTPHTFSLHAANARTRTLQGASIGSDRVRYGFEFTVPITLSRYFGASGGSAGTPSSSDTPRLNEDPAGGSVAVEVGMTNRLEFTPDTVRISAGETVRWRNSSALLHTVTADPEKAMDPSNVSLPSGAETFDSGNVEPGSTFEYTFTTPGTYQYVCLPHEAAGMVGWVVVSESQPDTDHGPDN